MYVTTFRFIFRKFLLLLILCGLFCKGINSQTSWPAYSKRMPVDYVFPQSGTEVCRWFFFNSACRPFGMVNLSPDTRTGGDWNNGYLYSDSKVRCFSHIHGWQLYGIAVLPFTGAPRGHMGMDAYQSDFSHNNEVVHPGYHRLVLTTYNITAELTSTMRVGMHRYSYPSDAIPGIYFDLGATLMDEISVSYIRKVSPTELEGYAVMAPTIRRPKPFTVYFVARFSGSITQFGRWKEGKILPGVADTITGIRAGAWLRFKKDKNSLLMKVAISYTSIDGARKNLRDELPHWDFDRVVAESRNEWNQWLGRIEVETADSSLKTRFYTDLWHSLLGRRIVSDADGAYCDNTGGQTQIKRVRCNADGKPLYHHHNFDALWGAHWSINLLWSLAYPGVVDEFCNTMLDIYQNGGLIPRGPAGGNYTFVMIGDPAASFFSAAYHKGIRNWDIATAWEGLRKNAFPGGIRGHAGYEHTRAHAAGGGIRYYVERGYIPEDIEGSGMHKDGASMTLEYAYQDWCLAQLATSLKKNDDARLFSKRAVNYVNLWDSTLHWMHPRNMDGSWLADFSPVANDKKDFTTKGFCEASGAIYTHYVPHDPDGLIKLFGGPSKYIETLNSQFEKAQAGKFIVPHGQHGSAWVDYENQPSVGMAYMFNYAGAPWLSQKWVRAIREAIFSSNTPADGYHGDEDQGMMGSVGALMAMGLFDEQGGAAIKPTWQLTAPALDKVTIHLDTAYYRGKTFTITARHASPENIYIKSVKLNGKPLKTCWFYHDDLVKGGELELELGAEPDKTFPDMPE